MKHCDFCRENFDNEEAYQIHLGIGAPAFHPCNDAEEMTAKGMLTEKGVWSIEERLIERRDNWAYLARKG